RLMAVGWIFFGLARFARPRPGARPRRTEVLRTSAAEREEGGLWNRLQARDALEAGARHRRRLAFGRRQRDLQGPRPQGRPIQAGRSAATERRLTRACGVFPITDNPRRE